MKKVLEVELWWLVVVEAVAAGHTQAKAVTEVVYQVKKAKIPSILHAFMKADYQEIKRMDINLELEKKAWMGSRAHEARQQVRAAGDIGVDLAENQVQTRVQEVGEGEALPLFQGIKDAKQLMLMETR